MILSIILILLIGGVAYFHYTQGFFSSTLSALSTVIAAVLAVGYHETLVEALLRGKLADHAHAITLVAIFALGYIALRAIFDNLIPGNIRLPVIPDRVGGAVMGVVAGLFTAGVVALAGQMLPFGPSIGGYARYELDSHREIQIMPVGYRRFVDVPVTSQLRADRLDPASKSSLIIPVDDMLLAVVDHLSDGGSLAGKRTLSSIHPQYTDQLFAQRLGMQLGAKRSALNLPGQTPQVVVDGLFRFDADVAKSQIGGEIPAVHQRPVRIEPRPNDFALVVRVIFEHNASDADRLVRVSPGAVRLLVNGVNYWPVGTVEQGMVLSNKLDDYLFIDVREKDGGADFLFLLDHDALTGDVRSPRLAEGAFLEVKRLARISLDEIDVAPRLPPTENLGVMRKPEVVKDLKSQLVETIPPIQFVRVDVSDRLFSPINVGIPDPTVMHHEIVSGTISIQDGKIVRLDIRPDETLIRMSQGDYTVDAFQVPDGFKLVQIVGRVPPRAEDPWEWGEKAGAFALRDESGITYNPVGVWGRIRVDQHDRMIARYEIGGGAVDLVRTEGVPMDVWIGFMVPAGTRLSDLRFEGRVLQTLDHTVR